MKAANETASRITKPERIERVVLFIITKSINFQWNIQIIDMDSGDEKGVATNLSGGFYV